MKVIVEIVPLHKAWSAAARQAANMKRKTTRSIRDRDAREESRASRDPVGRAYKEYSDKGDQYVGSGPHGSPEKEKARAEFKSSQRRYTTMANKQLKERATRRGMTHEESKSHSDGEQEHTFKTKSGKKAKFYTKFGKTTAILDGQHVGRFSTPRRATAALAWADRKR